MLDSDNRTCNGTGFVIAVDGIIKNIFSQISMNVLLIMKTVHRYAQTLLEATRAHAGVDIYWRLIMSTVLVSTRFLYGMMEVTLVISQTSMSVKRTMEIVHKRALTPLEAICVPATLVMH